MVQSDEKKKKQYINGLKGISAILILLGHFSAIYKMAETADRLNGAVAFGMVNYPLSFFFDENFWLYLFFIISGYLLAYNWRGSTIRAVLKKTAVRFLRLGIPVLGAGIVVLLIQNTVGFCNNRFAEIGRNTWFAGFYRNTIGFSDVLMEPIRVLLWGYSAANVPFWVLRDMFFASCLIYGCCALFQREQERLSIKVIVFAGICMAAALVWKKKIIVTCLLGMVGAWQEERVRLFFNRNAYAKVLCCIGLFAPFILFSLNMQFVKPIAFLCMLLAISNLPKVQQFLCSKIFLFLGRISFGIYAVHFPVICSFGFGSLLLCMPHMGASPALLVSLAVTLLLSIGLAVLFHLTVERFTAWVCRKI